MKTHDIDHDQDSDSLPSTPPPVPPRIGPASLRSDFPKSSRHGGPNSVEINAIADSSNRTNASDADVSISNGIDNSTATHTCDNVIANGSVPVDSETNQSNASTE